MKAKMIMGLMALMGTVSCATVQNQDNGVKVLAMTTGTKGGEWGLYTDEFKKAADTQCPDGYTVIEKSHKPEALKCAHDLLPDTQFFWVVQCNEKTAGI